MPRRCTRCRVEGHYAKTCPNSVHTPFLQPIPIEETPHDGAALPMIPLTTTNALAAFRARPKASAFAKYQDLVSRLRDIIVEAVKFAEAAADDHRLRAEQRPPVEELLWVQRARDEIAAGLAEEPVDAEPKPRKPRLPEIAETQAESA